jgi:hypothetical protein
MGQRTYYQIIKKTIPELIFVIPLIILLKYMYKIIYNGAQSAAEVVLSGV